MQNKLTSKIKQKKKHHDKCTKRFETNVKMR